MSLYFPAEDRDRINVLADQDIFQIGWRLTGKVMCPMYDGELCCDYPKALGELQRVLKDETPPCSKSLCAVQMFVRKRAIT